MQIRDVALHEKVVLILGGARNPRTIGIHVDVVAPVAIARIAGGVNAPAQLSEIEQMP